MAVVELQDADTGLGEVSFAAADGDGDQVPAGSAAGGWNLPVVLLVANASLAPIDVTVNGLPAAVTVPDGATAVIPVHRLVLGSLVPVTYSAAADVTVAAVRLTSAGGG